MCMYIYIYSTYIWCPKFRSLHLPHLRCSFGPQILQLGASEHSDLVASWPGSMLTSPWETVVLWDVTQNNDDLMG